MDLPFIFYLNRKRILQFVSHSPTHFRLMVVESPCTAMTQTLGPILRFSMCNWLNHQPCNQWTTLFSLAPRYQFQKFLFVVSVEHNVQQAIGVQNILIILYSVLDVEVKVKEPQLESVRLSSSLIIVCQHFIVIIHWPLNIENRRQSFILHPSLQFAWRVGVFIFTYTLICTPWISHNIKTTWLILCRSSCTTKITLTCWDIDSTDLWSCPEESWYQAPRHQQQMLYVFEVARWGLHRSDVFLSVTSHRCLVRLRCGEFRGLVNTLNTIMFLKQFLNHFCSISEYYAALWSIPLFYH